jgi:hypothetical protein
MGRRSWNEMDVGIFPLGALGLTRKLKKLDLDWTEAFFGFRNGYQFWKLTKEERRRFLELVQRFDRENKKRILVKKK